MGVWCKLEVTVPRAKKPCQVCPLQKFISSPERRGGRGGHGGRRARRIRQPPPDSRNEIIQSSRRRAQQVLQKRFLQI